MIEQGGQRKRYNINPVGVFSVEEMRTLLVVITWLIAAMMALPLIAAPAMADGMSWKIKTTSNSEVWSHVQERSQFSIINFNDGYEKMIISIQVAESELQTGTRMFWLFPIPSAPQNVSVDLVSDVPRLEGSPYSDKIWKAASSDLMWYYCVLGSQLWTLILAPVFAIKYTMVLGVGGGDSSQHVGVFEVAEKYGLHSEVISAGSASDLQTYLASQGIAIPSDDQSIVSDYISSGFSFVSTRIDNLNDFRNKATVRTDGPDRYYMMGVEADFPSDEIFFPLKLTSAYGDSDIPITVQVLDFVDISTRPNGPSLSVGAGYNEIDGRYVLRDSHYQYGYYPARSSESVNQTLAFFEEQIGTDWASHPTDSYSLWKERFTEIHIDGRASSLNSDLLISDNPPSSIATMDFFIANPWLIVLIIFISISTITGLIVGYHLDRNKKHVPQYLVIGLSNILTVLAPTLLYMNQHAWWHEERYGEKLEDKEALKKIRWKFFWTYTITFVFFTFIAWGFVSL